MPKNQELLSLHESSTNLLVDFDFSNFVQENRIPSYLLLEGTGFSVEKQLNNLLTAAKSNPEKEVSEVVKSWTNQTAEDVRGFWFEYLRQKLALPIVIEKKEIDGRPEIVCPKYSERPLIETTSSEERNGSVKDSLQKIVDFLSEAAPGSMAILISPSGWSGMKDAYGQDQSPYPDTQIYLYRVNIAGKIEAITIRTDNSLIQNETLLYILAGDNLTDNPFKSTTGRIENIVRNPIFLTDEGEEKYDFNWFIDTLQKLKGSEFVLKERTFTELRETVDERNLLVSASEEAENLIENFKRELLSNVQSLDQETLKIIIEKLGLLVLNISSQYRKDNNILYSASPKTKTFDHQEVYVYLQSLGGCNGGGFLSSFFNGPQGLRFFSLGESSENTVHCGKCSRGKSGDHFKPPIDCPNAKTK